MPNLQFCRTQKKGRHWQLLKYYVGPASLLRCAFVRCTADSALAKPPTCTRNIYIIRRKPETCQVNYRSKDEIYDLFIRGINDPHPQSALPSV